MIVLDASVILKWLFEEERTEKAIEFLEHHISGDNVISAPELIYYEIANVLISNPRLTIAEVSSGFNEIFNTEIETYSLGLEEFILAIGISKKYKITIYDASYIVLAIKLGCEFITADIKLAKALKKLKFVKCL